jgi:hypothetical protein
MNRCAGYGVALALAFLTAVSAAAAAAQESVLYRFRGGRDGTNPVAGLIAGANGVLYGTTGYGGDSSCSTPFFPPGCGTVFALSPPAAGGTRWTETVLHRFRGGRDGTIPGGGLIADANGALYGTTAHGGDTSCSTGFPFGGGGTVFALSRPAAVETRWTETVLHRFRGGRDGINPGGGLIADANGVLYGTSAGGDHRVGTVFALSPPAAGKTLWTNAVLYSFLRGGGGFGPQAGLIADANGVLYGTTNAGGDEGVGTVFALSPPATGETGWTHTVLYSFSRFSRDFNGSKPVAGLIAGAKGVLYGTTSLGGYPLCGGIGCGTVFALSPPAAGETRWTHAVLYRFRGPDGGFPAAGLIADAKGVLYGTTQYGGGNGGNGTVFALSPPAAGETR